MLILQPAGVNFTKLFCALEYNFSIFATKLCRCKVHIFFSYLGYKLSNFDVKLGKRKKIVKFDLLLGWISLTFYEQLLSEQIIKVQKGNVDLTVFLRF